MGRVFDGIHLGRGPGALNVGQIVTAYEGQGFSRTVPHKDANLPGLGTNLGTHESFEWVVLLVAECFQPGPACHTGAEHYTGTVADHCKHENIQRRCG